MKKEIRKNPPNPPKHVAPNGAPFTQEVIHVQQEHHGPLPDPRTLEQYNSIIPGAAERILVMAEQNARHAIEMDKEILEAQIVVAQQNHTEATKGQFFGIIGVLAMAAVASYALWRGYPTVAGIICSTTIIGLVTVFVTGKRNNFPQTSEKK